MPDVATKVMSMADDKLEVSFKELENIIKVDPGLSAKILKIANSALYARQREITSIQSAITLLGFKNLRSLVLLVTASNLFSVLHRPAFFRRFWSHSVHAAFISRHLSLRCGLKESAEEAFTGALLHDIGQVAFFNTDQTRYEEILTRIGQSEGAVGRDRPSLLSLEKAAFDVDHRELGASVFERWYFPDTFVDLAREHGSRTVVSPHKEIIHIVSIADEIADLLGLGFTPGDEETIAALLPDSPVNEENIGYYRSSYLSDIRNDPLFQQCKELFGIE